MTINQKKTKSHNQRFLPDELFILWGCRGGSHECVKYTLAYTQREYRATAQLRLKIMVQFRLF